MWMKLNLILQGHLNMCAANSWSIEFEDIDRLINNITKIPNRSEKVINESLREKGAPLAMQDIQPEIPVSMRKKKHAHDSKALSAKFGNLEFTIRPKRSFDYIKYPDLGIGKSKRNPPKHFMNKGLQKAAPKIIKDLNKEVISEINNTLGE